MARKNISYKKKYKDSHRNYIILTIFTIIIAIFLVLVIYEYGYSPIVPYDSKRDCFYAHLSRFCCDKEPMYKIRNTSIENPPWVYVTQCKQYSKFGNWS